MSAAITSGQDLMAKTKLPELPTLFTTFTAGHFVKPAAATQPVAAKPFSYTEVFVAAPLDLDYDEPNAVVEEELELVAAGSPVHQMEVPVTSSKTEKAPEMAARIAA